MKKKISYILVSGISLLISSCLGSSEFQQTATSNKSSTPKVTDTLTYHLETFKEFSPYFAGDEGSPLDTTYYSASYPVFGSDIDTLIKEAIFVDGEEQASEVSQSFLGGFNEYAEEQIGSDNPVFRAWFKNQICDVMFNIPGFLTLKNTISAYTGGAHGIQVELWSNYDTQAMEKLELTDIIDNTGTLTQIAERYFRKQEGLSDTSSYGDAYFFDHETFVLADNFGLTAKGLLFHYNSYEIKPYAGGTTTLILPYQAIEAAMSAKGKALAQRLTNK